MFCFDGGFCIGNGTLWWFRYTGFAYAVLAMFFTTCDDGLFSDQVQFPAVFISSVMIPILIRRNGLVRRLLSD